MPVTIKRDSSEGQALCTASSSLGELALPWELQSLHEALKGSPLDPEESPGPGHRSFLPAARGDGVEEVSWGISRWRPPVERRAPPLRGAGVATSARRLMALERRRMRRSTGANSLDRRPRTPSRLF